MKLSELQAGIHQSASRETNLLYLEQQVNDGYGSWKTFSDVDPQFNPERAQVFDLPYTLIEATEENITTSVPDIRLERAVRVGSAVCYFWHPDNKAAAEKNTPDGYVPVTATSSTRTLHTQGLDYNFMIKTSLPRRHYLYDRTMSAETARYSALISREFEAATGGRIGDVAFFPESLAVTHQGEGTVLRECDPRPLIPEARQSIPAFALYSPDRNANQDEPLALQIIGQLAPKDTLDYLLEKMIGPVQDAWLSCLRKRGILLDLHAQNCSYDMDEGGDLQRLVLRDFQSAYVDNELRDNLGLPQIWDDGFPPEKRRELYSLSYDRFIGTMFFRRLIRVFIGRFDNYSFEDVARNVANRFQERAGAIGEAMSPYLYTLPKGPAAIHGQPYILTDERPVFR